ncbi:MAG: histidine phosphatase family protein [Deltaproteobacteria bacterium]|nr:histidine phosphatase family protein [Deltaproteobacteria bacterium]MBW2413734.1 histidine phosphatase family protein [Deltaproteobacteria bacterium]
MTTVYYVTHPDVVQDPEVPVPRWPLSDVGRARMERLCGAPWVSGLRSVFCSSEQKALDGAAVLARHLGVEHQVLPELGENDRSSTGFMSGDAFSAVVDRFFAEPEQSVRGWETAADAQRRMVAAVDEVVRRADGAGDTVIVAHGGVGALLMCALRGVPISREQEQPLRGPEPGTVGGCWFSFDARTRELRSAWSPIDG